MDISNGQKVELWATSNKVQLFWEGHKNLKKSPTTGRRFFQIFSTSHNFLTLITVEEIWKSIRSPKWFAMLLFMSRIRETSLNLELFTFVEIRKIIKKMISWATGTRDLPFLGFGGLEIDCRTFQPGAFSTPKFKPKSFNPRFFFILNMGRGWKVRGRIELVSKEINHFGGIPLFFRDWALGILTGGA